MSENKKVYITFPKGEALSGWISDFLIHFKSTFGRISNTNATFYIKEHDFSEDNYQEFVGKSNIFILILGTSTDDDEQYQKELKFISESLDIENKNLTELSRIFKVCINPEHKGLSIENQIPAQTYKFYEIIKRRQASAKTLSFKTDAIKTWAKLLDLVYDIKDTHLSDSKENQTRESNYVYLGSCSENDAATRDDIKRELQHFGFRILPLSDLPEHESQLNEIVPAYLQQCQFFLQIIGSQYGNIAPGEKKSVFEVENNIIRDYVKSNNSCQRIIWVPANIKISDQKQNLFLNRLKQTEASTQTEIIETSQEEFKSILAQRVTNGIYGSKKEPKSDGIYLIAKPNKDISYIEQIAKKLEVRLTLNNVETGKNSYSMHLEYLKQSDCVLFYYDDKDEHWLKSNLKDTIKAQGLGKISPFLAIGIITETMPDISDIEQWLPKIFHIKNKDTESVSEFIKIVKI